VGKQAVVLEPGQNGATLDTTAFAQEVADSFLDGHEPVEVPVLPILPRISGDEIDTLGIDTLLGNGQSNYSDNVENRDENVRVGTEYVNSTLVPPGGTFSFNDAIGEITHERGFVESLVVQEGVGRDVGGRRLSGLDHHLPRRPQCRHADHRVVPTHLSPGQL
jgi:vancomycin resistance protein YoaR